mmetsp:Transcript_89907/g.249744  ORF Transcript_89907/g.249744 Transcript_89907/m.249744 type:complete len:228 (+) Transcript_89907:143-826(+)
MLVPKLLVVQRQEICGAVVEQQLEPVTSHVLRLHRLEQISEIAKLKVGNRKQEHPDIICMRGPRHGAILQSSQRLIKRQAGRRRIPHCAELHRLLQACAPEFAVQGLAFDRAPLETRVEEGFQVRVPVARGKMFVSKDVTKLPDAQLREQQPPLLALGGVAETNVALCRPVKSRRHATSTDDEAGALSASVASRRDAGTACSVAEFLPRGGHRHRGRCWCIRPVQQV